ncbi:MAG: hypothetical protein IK040_00650 [Spirochaetia bacterium]|nr:hypothetical protein [Spirochaetia bacterium]MBR4436201.1 hypothetical protein [Spirochaetales bacterium]MBR4796187.1 hypothetical protein [Spirochaetia bacterium]MBR5915595.1 hypothetical protein [Spirochaetia bacterium]MBR5927300.1 hypothetical protein [Spirochaetia bacterium]
MNQDQLADKLRTLADVPPFTLVFSGKKSKKVDGLYKPATQEILIHNKNMTGESDLIYTAIHEFAHHVVSCQSGNITLSNRCHTAQFWATFHQLLKRAEETGIYNNPFKSDQTFIQLTRRIKENFLKKNGAIMKDFAKVLNEARDMCIERHLSFEDYVDRELGMEKTTANTLLRIEKYDVTPTIGYDNMKTVAAMKDDHKREAAVQAFMEGESSASVKTSIVRPVAKVEKVSPVDHLEAEKLKIEKAIESLQKKLQIVDKMIENEKNKIKE